jgi:hypothetical protein
MEQLTPETPPRHARGTMREIALRMAGRTRGAVALAGVLAIGAPAGSAAGSPGAGSGTPMAVTVCGVSHTDKDIDAKLEVLRSMGVTSIQTYVFWNKVEKTPGVMDWSEYDADVALYRRHGLRWVPFVITGPWYVTPEFVRRDPQMVMLRCLEHGRDSEIPSIWCGRLREHVRAYYQRFAEHFRPMGVLESVNIGVSGDYGEAIYSVFGNWPGEYHSHMGFWCADPLAEADFRRYARGLYPDGVGALNKAWRSSYASFDEVRPFPPAEARSERAWQEFLRWYRDAMTSHADFCLRTAREFLPGTDIYLCTGGDMAPAHGSDFSAQAKAAARYQAGMRITNEASSFPMNVRMTRMVDSSCRFYGAYFGHEPAALVTAPGMLGRLFNAFTSGARQLFMYSSSELLSEQAGRQAPGEGGRFNLLYRDLLRTTRPTVDVALYYPGSVAGETPADREDFSELASQVRRFVDYDFIDDRLIQDGALKGKTILIMASAKVVDAATTARVRQWVDAGGIAFILDSRAADWDGRTDAFDALAGLTAKSDEVQGITELLVDRPKALPSIAELKDVYVTRGFTELRGDCEPLLAMSYDPKAKVAWRRKSGAGEVFAFFGPMDLRQREESWMVSQRLPLRFIKDGLSACVAEGILKGPPATLNLSAQEVYEVQTDSGLWVLNMGAEAGRIDIGGAATQVPPLSISRH